jgi:predicted ATP-grasp superfamily ATP-dependent carboligase
MAERHGVATARVSLIGSDADLDGLLDSFGLPVVVKRIAGWKAETRGVPSVTVARTRDEVRALGAAGWENFLLQEFIPGGSETSWMFNGCFDENSRCTFGLTGYKVRQFPLNGGFTTLGQLEPHEALLSTAVEFFRQVSYVGIVDVGFRFDARDNSYKLLDVNPRVGSTFRLFVDANGGDVVRRPRPDIAGTMPPVGSRASRPASGHRSHWLGSHNSESVSPECRHRGRARLVGLRRSNAVRRGLRLCTPTAKRQHAGS